MATNKYTGTGVIAQGDVHSVRWEGLTKSGKAVKITLPKAINMGNIDWEFKEKDDLVSNIVFTAVYDNTDTYATTTEPFSIECDSSVTAGAGEIILGSGRVYIDDVWVGLTRGGCSFNVEREFRPINADGDRGEVEGRIVIESSRPTLTINALQIITSVEKLYPAFNKTTA